MQLTIDPVLLAGVGWLLTSAATGLKVVRDIHRTETPENAVPLTVLGFMLATAPAWAPFRNLAWLATLGATPPAGKKSAA